MAYYFYLGKVLCPVPPEKLQLKINSENKTMTLINEGEVNILKRAGLTDVEFELLFPNVKYPFAVYKKGFKAAKYYLQKLEELKVKQKPFQFIVTRTLPKGKMLFDTNMKVSLEDYKIEENVKEGFDVTVSIKLKQYVDYGTKTCKVEFEDMKPKIDVQDTRETTDSPAPSANQSYTVVKGDCLWNIAKRFYGNGSLYTVIYNANQSVVGGNPNLIYPGQVLTIPPV